MTCLYMKPMMSEWGSQSLERVRTVIGRHIFVNDFFLSCYLAVYCYCHSVFVLTPFLRQHCVTMATLHCHGNMFQMDDYREGKDPEWLGEVTVQTECGCSILKFSLLICLVLCTSSHDRCWQVVRPKKKISVFTVTCWKKLGSVGRK